MSAKAKMKPPDPMLVWVRWHDACQREAADSPVPTPEYADLQHVGWWVAEDEKVLTIGMEIGAADVAAGRYRMNILKVTIVDRIDVPLSRAFKKPRQCKPRVVKEAEPQTKGEPGNGV